MRTNKTSNCGGDTGKQVFCIQCKDEWSETHCFGKSANVPGNMYDPMCREDHFILDQKRIFINWSSPDSSLLVKQHKTYST